MSQIEGETPRQLARDAWAGGRLWEAKHLIAQALKANPTGIELAHTRLIAGEIYRRFGDLNLAKQYLEELIAEWDQYPTIRPLLEGYAFYTLALVMDQRRLHAASVHFNRLAAEEFLRESMPDLRRRALQNAAWSLCWLGDGDGAVETLEIVEEEHLIGNNSEAWWQQRIGNAFATYAEGDHEQALELVTAIMRAASAPADVMCQAAWLAGRSQLALGNHSAALKLADTTIQWAVDANDFRCMSDAQWLRQQVVEAQARENEGA